MSLPNSPVSEPQGPEDLSLGLVSVCRAITEDGELTDKELYALAEWINAHPAAGAVWPGTELVKPLQDAWADGKINKTELRAFGRLLSRIERDWAKRQAAQIGEDALTTFSLAEARLPLIDLSTEVKSSSGSDDYRVNLVEASCTCPDWVGERSGKPARSISRCCKHIATAIQSVAPTGGWPGWLEALLSDCSSRGRGTDPFAKWSVVSVKGNEVLIGIGRTGWANVFTNDELSPRDGFGETRFGFNVEENRWSYGVAPAGSRTIKEAIRSLL